MNKLLSKCQHLYEQMQVRDQTIDEHTDTYIATKLIPMWPTGWMKTNEIRSNCMKTGKVKTKENKVKNASNPIERMPSVKDIKSNVKSSISQNPINKAHIAKNQTATGKMSKTINDKTVSNKTEKKHEIISSSSQQSISHSNPLNDPLLFPSAPKTLPNLALGVGIN